MPEPTSTSGLSLAAVACAEMLGLDDAWRFDPCVLRAAVSAIGGRADFRVAQSIKTIDNTRRNVAANGGEYGFVG